MISETQIMNTLEELMPEYTAFLSNLVKINSVYGQEKEAQLFVMSKMEEIGLNAAPFNSRNDEESINLVANIKGTDSNKFKSLILNAHCDITPVDDIAKWSKHPFSGEINNNILYGRGSFDDKAGIAIILLIASTLKKLNITLKGDLIVESVIEDETTGNGSKVLVDSGFIADGVIIIDGTWAERIIYAHLGQIWIDVEIRGEPVAACVESRGVNPIYLCIDLVEKLKRFINELNDECDKYEDIEKPFFINVGSLHSGMWHGSVPANAKMEIQIGFSNVYTPDQILDKVKSISQDISEQITINKSFLTTRAYKTDKNSQLITKLKSTIERNSKNEVKLVPVTGHCDMRHFPTQNICLYGPGGGKNAHGVDEYYFLDQMPLVAKNILEFILAWCNEAKHNLNDEVAH